MKLTITNLLFGIFLSSSLMGCGALSDDTKIEIQMYGIAKTPATAAGDRDPQFQTWEVQSITLDGAEPAALVTESADFKIVDRPQILVSRNAKSYLGKTYTGMTVVFGPTVTGGDNSEDALSFTISTPTLALTEAITFEQGKSKTYLIKASWENTLSTGTMTEPTLEISRQ
ncbi:MAG: hypothetical protein H7318_20225 [Oligoflexus sp.]|nr:hypothetical protein [Oligoflexus sp.]